MIVRDIKTKIVPLTEKDVDGNDVPVLVDGKPQTQVVPELDAEGREIELWSVDIPRDIEAKGGAAIDAHVAKVRAERAKAAAAAEPTTATPAKRGGKETAR